MDNQATISRLTKNLATRIHTIDVSSHAGIFGSDVADNALMQLRKASAELMGTAQPGLPQAQQIEALQAMESALRSANLVGVLSETELQPYLESIDELYALTEKES